MAKLDNEKSKNFYQEYYGFMTANKNEEDGIAYVNRIRRNKREKEYVKKLRLGIPARN